MNIFRHLLLNATGKRLTSAFLICFCLLSASSVPAEELSVKTTANRSQIYIGESFILEVTVSGSGGPAEVDFTSITNANIRALGSRNVSNYSITIINGKMSKEGFAGFVSSYEITPLTSGRFRGGPIGVKVGDKILTDAGPMVTVTDIEKQDRVILAVTASRETTLIDEPFEVTLSLKIRCLPGDGAALEPIFPDNPPALTVPWLDQELSGLAGPDLRQLLTDYLAPHWNQPGITINKFTLATDPFDIGSMFLHEPRKAKFALPRKIVQVNNLSYYEYNLQFDYVPRDEGNYVFGPVVFKGGVPERLDEHGRAVGANIFAVGPACTVRVIPPPEEGRPESYSGAIGSNMAVKASLDTGNCNVGDPLKLTLTVSGQVKLDKILPPRITLQTNILQRLTVYDNTVQTVKKDFYNQYIYTARPIQAGDYEIPPIEMAYYDVASRGYKKVFTSPIRLHVRRGAEVTEAQVIGNTNQLQIKRDETDLRQQAPAPMRIDNAGAAPASLFGDARIFALAGAGPALYLMIVFAGFVGRTSRKFRRVRRKQSAKNRACHNLKTAAGIGRADAAQAAGLICEAARQYLGERLNRETSAVTPAEAVRFLTENGVSHRLADSFGGLYEKYFNAGFAHAPISDSIAADCKSFQQIIRLIEKEIVGNLRKN